MYGSKLHRRDLRRLHYYEFQIFKLQTIEASRFVGFIFKYSRFIRTRIGLTARVLNIVDNN